MAVTLADVRDYASTLPRAREGFTDGRVKFYYGPIVFVAFDRAETVMGFGFPKEFREAAIQTSPEKFLMPRARDLRYNWLVVRLDAIDEAEMRDLVLEAWSMCASRKVIDEFVRSGASDRDQR